MMSDTYTKIAEIKNEWIRQWAKVILLLERSVYLSVKVKYIANGIYKFTQVLTIFGTKLIKLPAGKQIINSNSTKKRFTVASKLFT